MIRDDSNDPKDNIFPNWLVDRRDFRMVFTRFQDDSEHSEHDQLVKSFKVGIGNRTHEDLQRISSWMEEKSILSGVSTRRYLDLAKNVHYLEAPKGYTLCNQNEIGDAFYVIFSGVVQVIVDGSVMGELHSGDSFGERSLELNEPRSATCIAKENTICFVIKSHEYKLMMKMHQAQKFKKAMSFLTTKCKILKNWTYPKVFRFSGVLIRRIFSPGEFIVKQGEESTVMYMIYRGTVAIQKEVLYRSGNRWPDLNQSYVVTCCERMVALPLRTVTVGDFFGEEMCLGYNTRQYSAVCQETCECFAINKHDAEDFFRGNQVTNELREMSRGLYDSPEEVKEAHDTRVRQAKMFDDIKMEAFGSKYKQRASIRDRKETRRTRRKGPLEKSLQKMAEIAKSKSAKGRDVDGDENVDNLSVVSKATAMSSISRSTNMLPVLKRKTYTRRETVKERRSTLNSVKNSMINAGTMISSESLGTLSRPDESKQMVGSYSLPVI